MPLDEGKEKCLINPLNISCLRVSLGKMGDGGSPMLEENPS